MDRGAAAAAAPRLHGRPGAHRCVPMPPKKHRDCFKVKMGVVVSQEQYPCEYCRDILRDGHAFDKRAHRVPCYAHRV